MKSLLKMYDELQMALLSKDEEALRLYEFEKEEAEQYLKYRTKEEIIEDLWENKKGEIFTLLSYIVIGIHVLITAARYVLGLLTLKSGYFIKSPLYFLLWMVLPFAVWAVSTSFPMFNIRFRKIRLFYLAVISDLIMCAHILAAVEYDLFVPLLFKIPLTTQVSEGMIVRLSGLVLFLLSLVIPLVPLFSAVSRFIEFEPNKKELLYYKFLRNLDIRKNKEYAYDFSLSRNLDTGREAYIKMHDRFLQGLTQGPTGSGKTSQIFLRQVMTDLDQMAHNLSCQKKGIAKMFASGKVRLVSPFDFSDDDGYSIDCFKPVYLPEDGTHETKKHNAAVKKEFEFLKRVSCPAGILAMSPDPQFTDSVYKLAKARGIKVKRLDPEYTSEGKLKEDCVGFNPLYIRPGLPEWKYNDLVTKRASVISDTLSSINQKYGTQDSYFASVNETQTVNAVKLLILTYPDINAGRQPTLYDVYDLLNNFGKFVPLLQVLVKKYAVNREGVRVYTDLTDPRDINLETFERQNLSCGIWQTLYTTISKNLISKNLKDIEYDHGRGLRNQFEKIISPQQMNRIFNTQDSLDLDESLENGDIIIVNFSKASLGESNSSAFGQFFLLSYIQAVLARPLDGRFLIPTWAFIDEYPQIMSPDQTVMFELFRKFRVGVNIVIQDLKQLDMKNAGAKNPLPVIKSNARQKIVFAVSDPDDADYYSRLSGTRFEPMEQNTISESSLSNRDPNFSWSQRTTMQKVPRVDASDLIWQDFGEAYVYSVCDGSPVRPFQIQTSFLSRTEWLGIKYPRVLWENCASDEGVLKKAKDDNAALYPAHVMPFGACQRVEKTAVAAVRKRTLSCGKEYMLICDMNVPKEESSEFILKKEDILEPVHNEEVSSVPVQAVLTRSESIHGAMSEFLSLASGGTGND